MISLKKKTITSSPLSRRYRRVLRKYILFIIAGAICLLGILTFVWYINQSRYLISKVLYTTDSLSFYDDPQLYTSISTLYKKKTNISLKRFGDDTIEDIIRTSLPYIHSVDIKNIAETTLTLKINFVEPPLVVVLSGQRFALYPNLWLALYSGNNLGFSSPFFFLPSYLSESTSISGLLYGQGLEKLTQDIALLSQLPLSGKITYIPGGEKYIYRNDKRHIYFNIKKSITGQILYLENLMNNYPGFSSLTRIDLGSNELITVR